MAHLSLSLLGGFEVKVQGQTVTAFESNKVRALLAYLAVEAHPEGTRHGARPHERATLAGLLWPDHPEAAARTNLRHVLRQLRQTLPDVDPAQPLLITSARTIQLNPHSNHTLDVSRFTRLLADCEGCRHSSLAACQECIDRLTEAAALYRGEFLAGFSLSDSDLFEEWVTAERERLQRQALDLFFTLAALHEEQADWEQARHYAWRQLEVEPWREEAHRQLMRILARSGQRSAALAHYDRCRTMLADELGVEPDPETTALYGQIRGWGVGGGKMGSGRVAPPTPHPPIPYSPSSTPHQDWGEAPTAAAFYGRQSEQGSLRRWLSEDRHRLVVVLGMGGMGKTTLVAKVTRAVAERFDFLFWRSLLNAPPFSDILRQMLQFLSHQQLTQLPESIGEQVSLLFEQLRRHRCLLALDNLESILEAGQAGQYRPGYEGYGQLIERMAQSDHQSCLILTSRERPRGVARLEEDLTTVRVLTLAGLAVEAGQELLHTRGLEDGAHLAAGIVARYSGNPLALKLVARTIEELFDGDVAAFLSDETLIFDDIRSVLDQQFARLSPLERDLLVWLAIEREAVSLQRLIENLVHAPARRDLFETLRSLQRRSLLERTETGFILQNVVTEYLTDYLVDQICQEIEDGFEIQQGNDSTPRIADSMFNRHALFKAQAKEYVRQSQVRLIIQPIVGRLVAKVGETALTSQLKRILKMVQAEANGAALDTPGYAGGNILNLLLHLGVDITGHDFSNVCVWQGYLRGMYLPRLNLAGADLRGSAFTHKYGQIQGLQFRIDGELLVVGTSEGMVRVWRASHGELIHAVPVHDPVQNFVCLRSDQRIAALGGPDHSIVIVDITDGRVLHRLYGHRTPIWRLVFSPDGAHIASGEASGQIYVWGIESGQLLQVLQGHTHPITTLAYTPGGDRLASADVDGGVCLWEMPTGQLIRSFPAHGEEVAMLQFVLDGERLATCSHDHSVRLWNVRTLESPTAGQEQPIYLLRNHTQPIRVMAVDPQGRTLATGGSDKFIILWDAQTGQPRHVLADHNAPILFLTFSLDGQRLATLDFNETISVWDVESGVRVDFYRIHHSAIQAVAFSPDGQFLVSGGADWSLYLWDVSNPASTRMVARLQAHRQRIECLAFSPDGTTVASGDLGGEIRLWNIHIRTSRPLNGHQGGVRALAFSPDGRKLVSASADGSLCLWDVPSELRLIVLRGHTTTVVTCAFSPDGRWIASGSMDRTVSLWDARTGERLHTLHRHTNVVQQVRFYLDGRRLLTCAYDQTLCIWDAQTGQLLATWPTQKTVFLSLALHPNGDLIAAGGLDHVARLVEIDTGRVVTELRGHTRTVESVTLSPDGRLLVSAGHDETIKIWELASAQGETSADPYPVTLRAPGPYAGMNIRGTTGISQAQKAALMALGAVDEVS